MTNDQASTPQPAAATEQRTGLFTGSFDPFTIGHDDIVRRALPLFDRLVIGVVEGIDATVPPAHKCKEKESSRKE